MTVQLSTIWDLDDIVGAVTTDTVTVWAINSSSGAMAVNVTANGRDDEALLRGRVWRKPIEGIEPDDFVVSFDAAGNLRPGKVTRTFRGVEKIRAPDDRTWTVGYPLAARVVHDGRVHDRMRVPVPFSTP